MSRVNLRQQTDEEQHLMQRLQQNKNCKLIIIVFINWKGSKTLKRQPINLKSTALIGCPFIILSIFIFSFQVELPQNHRLFVDSLSLYCLGFFRYFFTFIIRVFSWDLNSNLKLSVRKQLSLTLFYDPVFLTIITIKQVNALNYFFLFFC